MLCEPSAQHGTDRGGDGSESRPRPDCAAGLFEGKRSADQRQTSRHEERAADTLQTPGRNELVNIGRKAAPGGCYREDQETEAEQSSAAKAVTQRPSHEDEGRQEKRVRFHNPLNIRERRSEA